MQVVDHRGNTLGWGVYNNTSMFAVRMLALASEPSTLHVGFPAWPQGPGNGDPRSAA